MHSQYLPNIEPMTLTATHVRKVPPGNAPARVSGVPEHFTASLVGHKSARSENGITYGIYSAGISDEQKRGIVDQIRLPSC